MNRNLLFKLTFGVFAALAVTVQFGCNKNSDTHEVPTVLSNIAVAQVTSTTAISGGIIANQGTSIPTAVGVCYSSTNQSPTIDNTALTIDTVKSLGFTSSLKNLVPGKTYYLRAYATNADGTGYGNVVKFTTPATDASPYTVSTFAGSGTEGLVNGNGTSAQFWHPQGMAADAQGNLFVADQFNHVIRKIATDGTVSTFCGNGTLGHVDGDAATAEFYSPNSIAIDAQNNLYVTDEGSNIIVKITPAGVATTIAGLGVAGYANSASPLKAAFSSPKGIAIDAQGNLYIADSGNNRIRKISASGVVSTLAGSGTAAIYDAVGTDASFNHPSGVAFDSKGTLYVADTYNYAIRKVSVSDGTTTLFMGWPTQTTVVGQPGNITFDASDNLYIADLTGRVLKYSPSTNLIATLGGTYNTTGFADGAGNAALFNRVAGIAVNKSNVVFASDYNNSRIRKITGN